MGKRHVEIHTDPSNAAEHKLADFLFENGEKILYGAGILLFIVLAILYFTMSGEGRSIGDFIRAEREVAAYQQGGTNVSLDSLQTLIAGNDDLKQKYASTFAQFWITEGNYDEAQPWIKEAERYRPLSLLPHYKSFADGAIFTAHGQLQKALDQSDQLQTQIAHREGNETLSALNLFRVAFLYQAMDQQQDELAAWEKVLADKGAEKVLMAVREGSLTMKDYVDERVRVLKN